MSDVLKMTYADIKTVKTRGVCQVVLEMPIEGMPDAFALLGAPVPGNEVWVAVARLRTVADGAVAVIEPPTKRGTLAQQAGILSNDGAFIRYAHEHATGDEEFSGMSEEGAAEYIRFHCGVKSRADLDKDEEAGKRFQEMRSAFRLWMTGIAA